MLSSARQRPETHGAQRKMVKKKTNQKFHKFPLFTAPELGRTSSLNFPLNQNTQDHGQTRGILRQASPNSVFVAETSRVPRRHRRVPRGHPFRLVGKSGTSLPREKSFTISAAASHCPKITEDNGTFRGESPSISPGPRHWPRLSKKERREGTEAHPQSLATGETGREITGPGGGLRRRHDSGSRDACFHHRMTCRRHRGCTSSGRRSAPATRDFRWTWKPSRTTQHILSNHLPFVFSS